METVIYVTNEELCKVWTDDKAMQEILDQWFERKGNWYEFRKDLIFRENALKRGTNVLKRIERDVDIIIKRLTTEEKELLIYLDEGWKTVTIGCTDYYWANKLGKYFDINKHYDSYVEFGNVPVNLVLRLNALKVGTKRLEAI